MPAQTRPSPWHSGTHTHRTANTSKQYDSLQQAEQQVLRCAVPRCAVLYVLRCAVLYALR